MKLFKFKLECANHLKDDGCLKGGTISEEELIEGASDAVIIEKGKLLDFEAEGLRDETFSPREKSVQRLFGEDDIFEKDKESGLM